MMDATVDGVKAPAATVYLALVVVPEPEWTTAGLISIAGGLPAMLKLRDEDGKETVYERREGHSS